MMAKKLILIFIILMSFCLISSVHAADSSAADDINVSFEGKVYEKDLGEIDVEIPQNTSGNLKAEIDGVEIYNENVTSSVKIPISIPESKYPILLPNREMDYYPHSIYLFFNDVELKMNHSLKVMKLPKDWQVQHFQTEILQYDDSHFCNLYFPPSADGEIQLFVDDVLADKFISHHYNFLNITKFNRLALSNHTLRVVYAGDDYYRPFNRTFSFDVVDMIINIPKNMIFDHDDCISARIINNRDGVFSIFVDSKLVFAGKFESYDEFIHSMFYNITCGEHLIEVQYNASKFSKSKRQMVNVSWYVDIFPIGSRTYGDTDKVSVLVPLDLKRNLIDITVDGIRCDFEMDDQGCIDVDVSRIGVGNHTFTFSYPGDLKYYSIAASENFTVDYRITVPDFIYFTQDCIISLRLPTSANGTLDVYVNGSLFESRRLTKGYASVNVNGLIPDNYNLTARYCGSDFDVCESSDMITVYPDYRTPGEMRYGEDRYLTVFTAKNAKGHVVFSGLDKNYTVTIKDGKASLSLKNIPVGEYDDVEMVYFGENGFNATLYGYVDIIKPKIRISDVRTDYKTNAKVKVYINDKLAKNTYVTFKAGKKTFKVKTDKNGVATLKVGDFKPGSYSLTASYMGVKSSKKLTVRHIVSLNSVKIKKSAKKVTVKVTVKNAKYKKVTVKFNGKTVKVKTDKKGIAKAVFNVKNLKVGKKIVYSATYLSDCIKKSVKVKK